MEVGLCRVVRGQDGDVGHGRPVLGVSSLVWVHPNELVLEAVEEQEREGPVVLQEYCKPHHQQDALSLGGGLGK